MLPGLQRVSTRVAAPLAFVPCMTGQPLAALSRFSNGGALSQSRRPFRSFEHPAVWHPQRAFTAAVRGQNLQVNALLDKHNVISIRDRILELPNTHLSWQGFLDICREWNLADEKQALKLAEHLEGAGHLVLLREAAGAPPQQLFLQLRQLAAEVVRTVDPNGVHRSEKVQEIDDLRGELNKWAALDAELQRKARNNATMKMTALVSYAVAQTAILARLTWWELSWDIMEPITWFIGATTGIGAMVFVVVTKMEYTHESVFDSLRLAKLEKLRLKANYDAQHVERLQLRMDWLKKQITPADDFLLLKQES